MTDVELSLGEMMKASTDKPKSKSKSKKPKEKKAKRATPTEPETPNFRSLPNSAWTIVAEIYKSPHVFSAEDAKALTEVEPEHLSKLFVQHKAGKKPAFELMFRTAEGYVTATQKQQLKALSKMKLSNGEAAKEHIVEWRNRYPANEQFGKIGTCGIISDRVAASLKSFKKDEISCADMRQEPETEADLVPAELAEDASDVETPPPKMKLTNAHQGALSDANPLVVAGKKMLAVEQPLDQLHPTKIANIIEESNLAVGVEAGLGSIRKHVPERAGPAKRQKKVRSPLTTDNNPTATMLLQLYDKLVGLDALDRKMNRELYTMLRDGQHSRKQFFTSKELCRNALPVFYCLAAQENGVSMVHRDSASTELAEVLSSHAAEYPLTDTSKVPQWIKGLERITEEFKTRKQCAVLEQGTFVEQWEAIQEWALTTKSGVDIKELFYSDEAQVKCWSGFLSDSGIEAYKKELIDNAGDLLAVVHLWKTREKPGQKKQSDSDDIDMMDLL